MPRLSSRITSDLFLVLTSLAIAFVIWMIAKRDEMDQENLRVPIRLVNVPPNINAQIGREQVQVAVTFPKSLRAHMRGENLVTSIDWDELPLPPRDWCGVENFAESPPLTLRGSHVHPAPDLSDDLRSWIKRQMQCTSVEPAKVTIKGRFITRLARIAFRTEGAVAEGYRLTGVTSSAGATALLTASPARLDDLERKSGGKPIEVPTEKIDLTGRTDSFIETVRLQLPPQTELVDLDRRLEAHGAIHPIYAAHTGSRLHLGLHPLNENQTLSYTPATAQVRVRGPERIVKELKSTDFIVRPARPPLAQPGVETTVALNAAFSDSASRQIIDAVTIRSVSPEVLFVRYDLRKPELEYGE